MGGANDSQLFSPHFHATLEMKWGHAKYVCIEARFQMWERNSCPEVIVEDNNYQKNTMQMYFLEYKIWILVGGAGHNHETLLQQLEHQLYFYFYYLAKSLHKFMPS